jgi:hypothetical protein
MFDLQLNIQLSEKIDFDKPIFRWKQFAKEPD